LSFRREPVKIRALDEQALWFTAEPTDGVDRVVGPQLSNLNRMERSMRTLLRRPVAGLVLVLCGLGTAWGQEDGGPIGAELLPPETVFMFSVPNVPELKERFNQTSSAKLLVDPEFQPFLEQIYEKVAEASKELNDEIGMSLDDLWSLPTGEFTLAVVEKPSRKLNAAILIDYGRHEETVEKLVAKVEQGLKDGGATIKTEKVGEVEVKVGTFPKTDQNPYNKIAWFTADNYWVIASDPAVTTAILERWDDESDRDTLADNEVFSYIAEQCATEDRVPGAMWYLDVMGLVKGTVQMISGQVPQAGMALGFLPVLGLDGLRGVGGTMDMGQEDYDAVSKTFIYADQPPVGVLGLFQFPSAEQLPPEWVPADTAMYLGASWNVGEAYSAVESLIDSFQGPGATAKLLDQLAEDESGPGVHPKDDFLDLLGGHLHVSGLGVPTRGDDDEPAPTEVPEFTFAISVTDADAMKSTLEKAAKSDGFPGEVTEVEGETVYVMPTDGDNSLSIAVVDEHLVIASTADAMAAVIAGKVDDSLVGSEAFQAALKHIPKSTSLISFSQGDSQMQAALEMIRQQAPEETGGIDLGKLPSYEAFQKYSKPSASYAIPNENGALFVGFTLADE
jgi:hypothetical protein